MAVRNFNDVERELRRLRRQTGLLEDFDRRLYERINSLAKRTGPATSIEAPTTTGLLEARDGLVGGGTFPGTVTIDERGEIHTGVHVEGEGHAIAGSQYVTLAGSELVEPATSI